MKKRINLFHTGGQEAPPALIAKAQRYSVSIGMVLFIIFLSINALFLYYKVQLNSLKQRKADVLSQLSSNQDIAAQILYFSKKQGQLSDFMRDDAQFLPYYNLLKDLLVFSSNSPILESMSIDKTKKTSFVVGFSDFDKAYNFLHYVESDKFLQNFESLQLDKFTITQSSLRITKGYELRFEGTFKTLNETKI